jgi:hypothetical protein
VKQAEADSAKPDKQASREAAEDAVTTGATK